MQIRKSIKQARNETFIIINFGFAIFCNKQSSAGNRKARERRKAVWKFPLIALDNLSSDIKMMADIRDGDVVMQVDGLSVQDLMSNPMKLMSYSSATSLPVTVMRNGRQETIYVNAASLSAKMLPTFGLKP